MTGKMRHVPRYDSVDSYCTDAADSMSEDTRLLQQNNTRERNQNNGRNRRSRQYEPDKPRPQQESRERYLLARQRTEMYDDVNKNDRNCSDNGCNSGEHNEYMTRNQSINENNKKFGGSDDRNSTTIICCDYKNHDNKFCGRENATDSRDNNNDNNFDLASVAQSQAPPNYSPTPLTNKNNESTTINDTLENDRGNNRGNYAEHETWRALNHKSSGGNANQRAPLTCNNNDVTDALPSNLCQRPLQRTVVIRENPLNNQSKRRDTESAHSDKKRELRHLRFLYRQRKLSLAKSKQSSFSSEFTETSADEMDENKRKTSTFKEVMFSKKMRKRAFWFIVVFLAALTIRDVVNLIIEYSENPKQSDMNIRFNESMTMPNITFCMSRAQAWSHFRLNANETPAEFDRQVHDQLANLTDRDSFLNTPWDYRTVMDAYNLISALTSMERETTLEGSANTIEKFGKQDRFKELRKTLKTWLQVLKERGVSFEEFTQKVGRETLRRSMQRFQRTSYNENEIIRTGVRVTWISQMQFCFQPSFDAANFRPIQDQGNFFTMVLSHNADKLNNQQVECMSVDFHGRASSSSRFSGSKGQARDGFNDELCMGMMHETTVEVKARYKMLPNDEEGTACQNHGDGDDTEFDCHARCRMNFIKGVCKCTAPTLSYLVDENELAKFPLCDYTNCTINVQTSNYSDDKCTKKCYRDCDQIRYEIDHEQKGKSVRPDLTTIYLNWGSFEYLTLEQDWVWSLSSFIAALGGSIGMWLGLSILSLIQGGTYMYKYLTQTVKKKRRRGVSTATGTDIKQEGGYPANNATAAIADPIASNPLKNPFKNKINASKSPPPPEYS